MAGGLEDHDDEAEDGVVQVEPPAEDRHEDQEAERLAEVHEGEEVRVVTCSERILFDPVVCVWLIWGRYCK